METGGNERTWGMARQPQSCSNHVVISGVISGPVGMTASVRSDQNPYLCRHQIRQDLTGLDIWIRTGPFDRNGSRHLPISPDIPAQLSVGAPCRFHSTGRFQVTWAVQNSQRSRGSRWVALNHTAAQITRAFFKAETMIVAS